VRICDVSLDTLRMLFIIKGRKLIAASVGFFEVLIWFLIVREALNTDITSLWVAISYAGGFATGTVIGGVLSDKFISGNLTVQVILSDRSDEIVTFIRKAGYAVSVIDVKGQDEERPKYILLMEINKKLINQLKKLIKSLDEKAFIIINETKLVHNGYFN
jgi:uncharacterized protein YebE (UPF0316 family)